MYGLTDDIQELQAKLNAANHDIKELKRCVADYKAENKRQKHTINAFLAYQNFIKSMAK